MIENRFIASKSGELPPKVNKDEFTSLFDKIVKETFFLSPEQVKSVDNKNRYINGIRNAGYALLNEICPDLLPDEQSQVFGRKKTFARTAGNEHANMCQTRDAQYCNSLAQMADQFNKEFFGEGNFERTTMEKIKKIFPWPGPN